MKVVVLNHMSLDGVIQSPARLDEDTRGGFNHGGWAAVGADEAVSKWVGPVGAGGPGAMLMGRRSYEGMLGHWNEAGGPFKGALNAATKYVASRNASTQLHWPNSTLLTGDVSEAVARLKRELGGRPADPGKGRLDSVTGATQPH
jgi:dihydrofolate reductase